MPAPKAVLRDIHDLGLDPAKPWIVTDKGGRLTSTPKAAAVHAGVHINQMTVHKPVDTAPAKVEEKAPEPPKEPEKKVEVAPPPAPPKVEVKAPEPVKVEEKKPEPPKTEDKVEAKKEEPKPVAPVAEAPKPVEKPADDKPVS